MFHFFYNFFHLLHIVREKVATPAAAQCIFNTLPFFPGVSDVDMKSFVQRLQLRYLLLELLDTLGFAGHFVLQVFVLGQNNLVILVQLFEVVILFS